MTAVQKHTLINLLPTLSTFCSSWLLFHCLMQTC